MTQTTLAPVKATPTLRRNEKVGDMLPCWRWAKALNSEHRPYWRDLGFVAHGLRQSVKSGCTPYYIAIAKLG